MLGLAWLARDLAARGGARRARCDRRVRARGRAAAVRDPRGRRRVRSRSLAWLTGRAARPLVRAARRGDRAARLESLQRARPGLSALVRRGALDLRARAALPACARGLSGALAAARAVSRSRPRAASARRRSRWLHFHAIPLLTVPANAAAAPVVAPMLALALVSARSWRRSAGPARSSQGERLVRRVPRRLCAVLRRAAGRADPLARGGRRARGGRAPGGRLCLAAWRRELKPVYLLTGSDRPKIARALRRLRDRIGDDATEHLNAREASAEDVVAACNSMGLFVGEAARDRRRGRALEGGRREGDRRLSRGAGAGHGARARRRGDQGRLRAREGGREGAARCSPTT